MRNIMIVSGGHVSDGFVEEQIRVCQPDYIIAADSGMECLRRIGLNPDMIIGDFDSVQCETLSYFKAQTGIEWKELNPIKDDTDTEFAIHQAIALGATDIVLLGATGSRLDHVLGNVALLGIGLKEQVSIEILDEHNRIRMINAPIQIKKAEQFGTMVSLIPYAGEVKSVTLKGFKYPLENATIGCFTSLGISNEIVDDVAEILLKEGILLVIEARD